MRGRIEGPLELDGLSIVRFQYQRNGNPKPSHGDGDGDKVTGLLVRSHLGASVYPKEKPSSQSVSRPARERLLIHVHRLR